MTSPFELPDLAPLIGRELRQSEVARALAHAVRRLAPRHFASLQLTCSDGRERETTDVFRSLIVREFGPGEVALRAPMRSANLGARYEWGSAPLSLGHYCAPGDTDVLHLAKINSHVASWPGPSGPIYGTLERGGSSSTCCGAIAQYLNGGPGVFVEEMALVFSSEGLDRTALLHDPAIVPTALKPLIAALVHGRLQARRAMLDILAAPRCADKVLVLAALSVNHPTRNNELVIGHYAAERGPRGELHVTWTGLGDDPRALCVELTARGLEVRGRDEDGQPIAPKRRPARGPAEHRALPARAWLARHEHPESTPAVRAAVAGAVRSLEDNLNDPEHPVRAIAIKTAILAMAETMAVPALLTLFAGGAIDLHHAWRVERIAYGQADEAEARALLNSAIDGLETLDAATCERVIRSLERHFA